MEHYRTKHQDHLSWTCNISDWKRHPISRWGFRHWEKCFLTWARHERYVFNPINDQGMHGYRLHPLFCRWTKKHRVAFMTLGQPPKFGGNQVFVRTIEPKTRPDGSSQRKTRISSKKKKRLGFGCSHSATNENRALVRKIRTGNLRSQILG